MIEKREDRVKIQREDGTFHDKLCTFYLFTEGISEVLKFRFEKFEKIYKKHIKDIDIEKFNC